MEIADAEELFDFPLHPYTRSLISAIPIPDPKLEKNKKLFTYDPSVHDYSKEKPELVEIGNNHFVYGSPTEIAEYKRIREEGVPIKSVTILTDEEKAALDAEAQPTGDVINEAILNKPLHDTGSLWYTIASFFLPIIGIIAGLIFKKKNHISNFKACLKGALIGIGVFVFIVALFLLMLWSATL